MFIKLGESIEINRVEDTQSCIPAVSSDVLDNFKKFAANLKKVAPKAEDFLYFSAVIMHAAEASSLNDDGTIKVTGSGEPVKVGWDKSGNTWKWVTNDPSIRAYKNANGDIFPEEELVIAHKKWVGKPLCIDHKSNSVDHVRGFIVDTYYDRNLKRVIALCALDKAGYPQLARQVSTGVSTSVSMGTAVGKAICYDCSKVAKIESDFCDHMRRKTCYGEINIDLSPIELSIVVNGADPKAHIKHIIAAANTLNNYVDSKAKDLDKFASSNTNYYAELSVSSSEDDALKAKKVTVGNDDFENFKEEVIKKLDEFENMLKDTNDSASNQSESSAGEDVADANVGLSPSLPGSNRLASGDNSMAELRQITASIYQKLQKMQTSLDNLSQGKQEENMSDSRELNKKGYFQGTAEPTTYPKDPLNEKLRTDGDKHMTGQMETGPVTGMHPGPDSVEMSELERKKMLARAEAEDRAMRRSAIVNMAKQALNEKTAYFQGGGGVNEPTPGKVKYPADKLNEQMREDGDKQMVGQKPFPGVGDVDGLHPSPSSVDTADELKRKQMLARAGLRAKFVKAANFDGTQNLGKSGWEVYYGDKLILTASVNELSGGRSEILYDSIATKDFGSKLIEKIKIQGADSVRSLIKKAQGDAPAAPPAPPAPDAAAPPAPEAGAPGLDMGAMGDVDTEKTGDPKETALELAEKARDVTSDLVEAVRALVGEKAEMGKEEAAGEAAPKTASFLSTSNLNVLRKELNGELTSAMKETIASLNEHQDELNMIADIYSRKVVTASNEEFVDSVVEEAFEEVKTVIADAYKLMTAFVKYARGTQAIVKRAEVEKMMAKDDSSDESSADDEALAKDLFDFADESDSLHADVDSEGTDLSDESHSDDDNDAVVEVNDAETANKLKPSLKTDDKLVVKDAALSTKQGRAALRAKLAADALGKMDSGELQDMTKAKFSDMLEQANKLTDGDTELDVKPSDNLGRVETLPEKQKAMMDVALAPVKVRKEAEAIHKLISEGKLDAGDLNALVAEGLDSAAVAYYKKYYGQVDGGSEFASELVKEHVKAHLENDINSYKVKLARAYDLAYDMVDRGLCHNDRNAVSAQVDEIMKFNDESFDSLKRVVAKHNPVLRKEAGRMPQVGIIGSGEVNSLVEADDYSLLSSMFSKTSKRMF